jgi:hypothetical protein
MAALRMQSRRFRQRNRIEFDEIVKCVLDQRAGTSEPRVTKSHVKLALQEMARRDMVVLSSDEEPIVFAVSEDSPGEYRESHRAAFRVC